MQFTTVNNQERAQSMLSGHVRFSAHSAAVGEQFDP